MGVGRGEWPLARRRSPSQGVPTPRAERGRDVKWEAGNVCCRPWPVGGGRSVEGGPAGWPRCRHRRSCCRTRARASALQSAPASSVAVSGDHRAGRRRRSSGGEGGVCSTWQRCAHPAPPAGTEEGSAALPWAAEKAGVPWITLGACLGKFPFLPPLSPLCLSTARPRFLNPDRPLCWDRARLWRGGALCHRCWCFGLISRPAASAACTFGRPPFGPGRA